MGRDNQPKERQRRQLERKRGNRASYDRILIVSEGTKTEPNYFKEIRSAFRLHTTNVAVQPGKLGTSPIQVIQYAQQLFSDGDRSRHIEPRAFEYIFALFDRDDHRTFFDALEHAAGLNGRLRNDNNQPVSFRAIASVPNFELWLLLHYEDIQSPLHRAEVLRRLKARLPGYEKGCTDVFSRTGEHLATATRRAEALAARLSPFSDGQPYTLVHELVKLLVNLRT